MSKCSLLLLSLLFWVSCSPNNSSIKVAHCDPLTLDSDHPLDSDAAVTEVNLGSDAFQCPVNDMEPTPQCPQCEVCLETPLEPTTRELNIQQDRDNLYAWRKTRASLNTEEDVVFYWVGYVYNHQAKDPSDFGPTDQNLTFESPLFRFEGFNIARFADDGAGGFVMLSREVSVYQDPNTNEIIDCWRNPLLEESLNVRVMHVANDPVNFGVGYVSHVELGNRISFFSDVLIAYRSPLAGEPQLSPYSASDVYQSNELFNFIASREDLENEALDTVPVEISWTRVGQYLPWMQMGDRSGQLIYHARGYKVLGGVQELPTDLLEWTNDVAGDTYLAAPNSIPEAYTSNATSWRVFKSSIDDGNYTPSCP